MDYTPKNPYGIRVNYQFPRSAEILAEALRQIATDSTVLVCIGTDRCIGDALGPLVGTILQQKGFPLPLYGTLDKPLHAVNLEASLEQIQILHPNAFFIAVDACLGEEQMIGTLHIKKGPIFPGKGVGKKLPGIGHMSVMGTVDKIYNGDPLSIHNIRLSLIMNMANVIANAFLMAL